MATIGGEDDEGDDEPLDAAIRAVAPDLIGTLNADFDDSVLLVGRVLGARRAATAATVTGIDRDGLDLTVAEPDRVHSLRVHFANGVTQPTGLTPAFMELVTRARAESGEAGLTTAERMTQTVTATRTVLTTVHRVESVHPHLRRITFAGGDLAAFAPTGPDTFLYVLLPPPGRSELTIDRSFTWDGYERMAEAERPVGAYYTVRRWDPETTELEMLFVLHGDEGPASAWAGRARAGDPVALWGPRTAFDPPADTDRYLLVADETGLPAVAAILEALPNGTPAHVFAEVADERERQMLPSSASIAVTWCYRNGAEAGTTTLLRDTRARAFTWPGGTPYVWGGGESRAMTAVRTYVRHEMLLPRERVSLVAYWRHARLGVDHVDY